MCLGSGLGRLLGCSLWDFRLLVLLGTSDREDLGEADAPGVACRQESKSLTGPLRKGADGGRDLKTPLELSKVWR